MSFKNIALFLLFTSLSVLIYFVVVFFIASSGISKWGNHLTFENELGIAIDSLQIFICTETTSVIAYQSEDGSILLEGNVSTPEKGEPCSVLIKVFSGTKILSLIGDDFNCNHCDIDQRYRLTPNKAVYEYSP